MPWAWNPTTNKWEDEAGKPLTQEILELVFDGDLEAATDNLETIFNALTVGAFTFDDFLTESTKELTKMYIRALIWGRGGITNVTAGDWGAMVDLLREQIKFFEDYTQEIELDRISEHEAHRRLLMYANSARAAYEMGSLTASGVPLTAVRRIPQPGDGSTDCKTNCKCHWRVEDDYAIESNGERVFIGWRLYWELGAADHCETCLDRRDNWYPLVITP
jgi:hypothetical protein